MRGRVYSSAHLAAFQEASSFFNFFWFSLDKPGYEKTKGRFFDSADELYLCFATRKEFNAALVVSEWEQAKAYILELLHDTWRADFNGIGARIERERAHVVPGEGITDGLRAELLVESSRNGQPKNHDLTTDDITILKALEGNLADVLVLTELSVVAELSEKTLRNRLKPLMKCEFIRRPVGMQQGYVITKFGRKAIEPEAMQGQ